MDPTSTVFSLDIVLDKNLYGTKRSSGLLILKRRSGSKRCRPEKEKDLDEDSVGGPEKVRENVKCFRSDHQVDRPRGGGPSAPLPLLLCQPFQSVSVPLQVLISCLEYHTRPARFLFYVLPKFH